MRGQIREVRILDLFLYLILPAIGIAAEVALCVCMIIYNTDMHPILSVLLVLIPFYTSLKYFVIGAVLAYKAFAPLSLRDRCRYDPCCSTYMIIAIRKYGLIRGLYKGIRRISRCKPPYGGTDLP